MKLTRHTPAGFVLCLTLALYGCGSRPDEQLALAQKAMDQAKEQRAAEFAPSEWRNAEDAWQKAQALLASESYGEAGTLFLRAKSRYEGRMISPNRNATMFGKKCKGWNVPSIFATNP